jgi:hypothetical protein
MQDHSERSEIGKRLKNELENAHAEYLAARTRLDSLVKGDNIYLPHTDTTLPIQQSGLEARTAFRNYSLALKRFANFTELGIVPEDLLSSN